MSDVMMLSGRCRVRAGRCAAFVAMVCLAACRLETGRPAEPSGHGVVGAPAANVLDGSVERFDPDVDYFPHKATFTHATQLHVEYHGHYKLVTFVSNSVHERLRYLLVQRGTPIPEGYSGAQVFEVPATQFALASYRYGGAADLLGVTDRLIAFRRGIATTPSIVRLIENGLSDDFSAERMAALDPDVVISYYANQSLSTSMNPYVPLGVREVSMAEHLEPTPLAKAEWIKFFAMFFNHEAIAERHFAEVEAAYQRVSERVRRVAHRPAVALNAPFRGRWSVPGGRNALARLIADAGGTYIFADDASAASIRGVSVELALDRAMDADAWIIDAEAAGRRDLAHAIYGEPVLARAPALQTGNLWVCNLNPGGHRNPYWDQGLLHPDRLLADLVHILHPDVLGPYTPAFHRRLERPSSGS